MLKKDIKNFTLQEFKREMETLSMPTYRAEQVFYWVYKRGVSEFSAMNNLPKDLRDGLDRIFCISNIELEERLKSKDRSEKFLFRLSDRNFIESVVICSGKRRTLCLSTQVGCKFGCVFCASGMKGFVKDLTASEIINQILFLQHRINYSITNFVFMGMGEPFDNYDNLIKAIKIMNSKHGLDIGARRITVSTCGLIPGIERFKELGLQVNLSISLHAVNNNLRNKLVPINKKYPLEKLIAVCQDFVEKTGRMPTLEYVLIKGINDSLRDAKALSVMAKRLRAKVNLISYSPVIGKEYESPLRRTIDIFKKSLDKSKIGVTVRESKGKDIQAACGQLALHRATEPKVIEDGAEVW